GVGIIGAILIGILAGWIAEKVMHRNHGLLTNLIVGVVGAFLGSFIATSMGIGVGAGVVPSLLVATAGAVLLLFIVGLFRRRSV
uniref:GlsB/YeaQ/YmgE family stress response membrane protein n=1 Tax=Phenylobacterium sp. TaxID=1871053 RepID=UPI0025F04D72